MRSIILALFLFSPMGMAYDVNVFDSPTYKDKVIIVIIDNCNKSFKLELKREDLGTSKALKWLEKISRAGLLDNC